MTPLKAIRRIKKLQLKFDRDRSLKQKLDKIPEPIEQSATDAMARVGNDIKHRGRQNIAAAGFGSRWQNALRVNLYPRRGASINPALWIYHKIPYSEVFESGATIFGKPLLWIPLPSVPKKVQGRKMTPRNYIKFVGPLFKVQHPGKPPLLMAKFSGRARGRSIAKRSLRGFRAAAKGGEQNAVPVFVGVSTVRLRKRFSLRQIFRDASKRLAEYYSSSVNTRIK
jgi:hypothetical protein